jgi:hypothetical protein
VIANGVVMAKIIQFYVPDGFVKIAKWIPPEQRGKLIPFPGPEQKKSA